MQGFTGASAIAGRFPNVDVPDVDIGVIYTHERTLMPRLLSTLNVASEGVHRRLVLVDNDSADGVEPWTNYFADTKVVRNTQRLPYSANLNRILRASRAPLVLLLNTDMFFDPHEACVSKMVNFMRSRPDCGIAGCRLYQENGRHAPSARRFQTISTILARRFGLGSLMQRTLDNYFYRERSIRETWECDWLSGCFMMVRRDAVEEVGLFDVGFGKYFEDVDMCLRMSRMGWQVMYHGATHCYHLGQRASTKVLSPDARKHARAYLRWLLKWGFAPDRDHHPGLQQTARRQRLQQQRLQQQNRKAA